MHKLVLMMIFKNRDNEFSIGSFRGTLLDAEYCMEKKYWTNRQSVSEWLPGSRVIADLQTVGSYFVLVTEINMQKQQR